LFDLALPHFQIVTIYIGHEPLHGRGSTPPTHPRRTLRPCTTEGTHWGCRGRAGGWGQPGHRPFEQQFTGSVITWRKRAPLKNCPLGHLKIRNAPGAGESLGPPLSVRGFGEGGGGGTATSLANANKNTSPSPSTRCPLNPSIPSTPPFPLCVCPVPPHRRLDPFLCVEGHGSVNRNEGASGGKG